MALRVLLADESVTIKKAFELALQDYGVDIVSVNAGVDVVPVSMKFKPDIIFADVLLQKKNGYELSEELKSLDETKQVPVVLIWSGFMELDKVKFKKSMADDQLEKPFDTDKLRSLIQKLVPRLKTQKISQFLNFPRLPDFDDKPPAETPMLTQTGVQQTPPKLSSVSKSENQDTGSHWNVSQFEDISKAGDSEDSYNADDFSEHSLQTDAPQTHDEETGTAPLDLSDDDGDSPWVSQTLSQFKMDKDKLNTPDEVAYEVPEDTIDPNTLIRNRDTSTSGWTQQQTGAPPPLTQQSTNAGTTSDEDAGLELELPSEATETKSLENPLSERQVEAIIKAQAREIIEKVVWEVVPEIATQIIEREIKKLLQEQNDQELD